MKTPWVSFDGKDCSGCKHLNDRGYCKFTACIIPCSVRATIPEVKPKTNADRIRSMTDEDLAAWCVEHFLCPEVRPWCETREHGEIRDCKKCWFDWLIQEADDGD